MKDIEQYLSMQKSHYDKEANTWSLENKNPVVGSYDEHNAWEDYDNFLFKNIETVDSIALEYGCGPGRNIIKFNNVFSRIDGVDISHINLEKAEDNLRNNKIKNFKLFHCDGKSIPVDDSSYDIIFSVICLQHISCYDIRFLIFSDIYRSLKPGGYFCFQMGFGGKEKRYTADYYSNDTDAKTTNGGHDVSVTDPGQLENDLLKIGFKNFSFDIRETGPGDDHRNWIWARVQK